MQGLDVFCLASSFEGMSNSLMESMSLGLPVVVSDIPANLELVDHEVNGLTFPVTKAPDLAKSVRRVLEDSDLAENLGTAAAETTREECGVERMIQEHLNLYQHLLPDSPQPKTTPAEG